MFGRVSANGSLQFELVLTEYVVMLSCLFAGIVSHCLDLLQPILLVADSDNSKLVILGLQALQRLFTHETIPDVGRHWAMMTSFTEVVFWPFVQWLIGWLASFVSIDRLIDWLICMVCFTFLIVRFIDITARYYEFDVDFDGKSRGRAQTDSNNHHHTHVQQYSPRRISGQGTYLHPNSSSSFSHFIRDYAFAEFGDLSADALQ